MHLDAKLVLSLNGDLVITAEGVTTTIRKEAAGPFMEAIQDIAREIRGEPRLAELEPEPEPEPAPQEAREEGGPRPEPQPQLQLPEPQRPPDYASYFIPPYANGRHGKNGNAMPSLAAWLAQTQGPVFRERHHPLIRKHTLESTLLLELAKLDGVFSIFDLKRHLLEAGQHGEGGEEGAALLPERAAPVVRSLRDKGLVENATLDAAGRSYAYRLTSLGADAVRILLQEQD
jgi:hypothetical protein